MKTSAVFALCALLLASFVGALPAAAQGGSVWLERCVDCPKTFGLLSEHALRLDVAGRPHVAYGGDHLYYAWYDGSAWQRETVDAADGVGALASLALDAEGQPHIAYLGRGLQYAYRDAGGWHLETVDSRRLEEAPALAIGPSGRAHVAYIVAYPAYALFQAVRFSYGWRVETVESGQSTQSGGVSLGVDKAGRAQISYYNGATNALKHAYVDDSGWHSEVLGTGGWVWSTSLALDDDGYAHIGAFVYNSGLRYAYRDAAGWHQETVDAAPTAGQAPSLALDAQGQPHMSYFNNTYPGYSLRYASRQTTGWLTQTVATGRVGTTSALALAGAAGPRIAAMDETRGALLLARWQTDHWVMEDVDWSDDVGYWSSLALDRRGAPHIAYRAQIGGLKIADWSGSDWGMQDVDVLGFELSLALDGSDRPRISYISVDSALRYASWNGTAWITQTVDSGRCRFSSLALDHTGNPRISYASDWPDYDLRYAQWNGTRWLTETVDALGQVGRYNSLALGKDGHPQISYYDQDNGRLKYAQWTAGAWAVETVDSAGNEGRFSTLALDGQGDPHISYVGEQGLRYARWMGDHWQIQTVSTQVSGEGTALALDGKDRPRIAFCGADSLLYARWTGSAWEVEPAGGSAGYSLQPSLALDRAGRAHISSYDFRNKDLRYAMEGYGVSLPLAVR
jgi:hypothetical protein